MKTCVCVYGGGVASQNLAEWGTCLSKPHAPRAPRCHQGPLIRNQSLSRALPALHDLCQPLFQPHLSFHLHHQVSYPAATLPRSGLPSPAPGNGCRELQPVHGQKMEASRFGCNAHAYTDASLLTCLLFLNHQTVNSSDMHMDGILFTLVIPEHSTSTEQ